MKRIRGETTLDQMQRAYLQTQLRAKALRICEELDRSCNYASAEAKQDAMVTARYWINRCR